MWLPILISLASLAVSIIVAFENYLKPFKLFIFPGRSIPWVFKNGDICIDLIITFFNFGSRSGIIENIQLEFSDSNNHLILKPTKIKKLSAEGKFIDETYWNAFALFGKSEVFKIISFKSDVNIIAITDGNFIATLDIFYKKKISKKKSFILKKEILLAIEKEVAIANSPGYQKTLQEGVTQKR